MKKSSIFAIIAAIVALAGSMVLLCIYMKQLRKLCTDLWDKLQAKRSNLQIYMD